MITTETYHKVPIHVEVFSDHVVYVLLLSELTNEALCERMMLRIDVMSWIRDGIILKAF